MCSMLNCFLVFCFSHFYPPITVDKGLFGIVFLLTIGTVLKALVARQRLSHVIFHFSKPFVQPCEDIQDQPVCSTFGYLNTLFFLPSSSKVGSSCFFPDSHIFPTFFDDLQCYWRDSRNFCCLHLVPSRCTVQGVRINNICYYSTLLV